MSTLTMTRRQKRKQKLWLRLTELQQRRQHQERAHECTQATIREMVKVRKEIIDIENREDDERQRAA